MAYQISIRKGAIKILEDINEPYYSKIKTAIYHLADNPRPTGYKKLKGKRDSAFGWLITGLFMKFLMMN